jgi:hypothetical protein
LGTFVVSVAGTTQQASFQVIEPHLAISLTTDKSVYHLGEPVQITLTETNTRDQPVTIELDHLWFTITHDGNWVWGNDDSCYGNPTLVTLQPGQSFARTVTWNGIANGPLYGGALNPSGTFVVSVTGTALQASFQVADAHLVYSLTTDKSVYHVGEPVQITFSETNTGDQPVTILPDAVMFSLMHNQGWVWGSGFPFPYDQATITLQPGQSYSKTVTWDGFARYSPYGDSLNPSGTFVVSVAGTALQASFQVVDPQLVYNLITDKSVYHAGEPVQITLTETNTGDQPVTLDPDLLEFQLRLEGFPIWWEPSWCENQPPVTLQPGESYTETITWDGDTENIWQGVPVGALGMAVVSVEGISAQASFQIIGLSVPSPASREPVPGPSRGTALAPTDPERVRRRGPVESLGPPPSLTGTAPTGRAAEPTAQPVLGPATSEDVQANPKVIRRPHWHHGTITVLERATWPWRSRPSVLIWAVRQVRWTSILRTGSER